MRQPNIWSMSTQCRYSTDANNVTKDGQQPTQEQVAEEISDESSNLENLQSEICSLQEKSKDLEDKYKRALAETENVRQRMKKQVEDAKQFGIQSFCKDLLTVADTLNLASDNIPVDQLENEAVKSMHKGLKLTETQLLKVFKDHGVNVLNPQGEKFDPNYHEALFQQPLPEQQPGTVFAVTKVGYTLNDRVLRPALVGVVKSS